MLKRLHLQNFTVFADADFEFGEGLNVLVGTNGTGKSHVLKLGYAIELACASAPNEKRENSTSDKQDNQLAFGFAILSNSSCGLPRDKKSLFRQEETRFEVFDPLKPCSP